MQVHAYVTSPLGPILLSCASARLQGLHFVGEKSCPNINGLPTVNSRHARPQDGLWQGRPARLLHAVHKHEKTTGSDAGTAAKGPLVGQSQANSSPSAASRAAAANKPFGPRASNGFAADPLAELQLLQNVTDDAEDKRPGSRASNGFATDPLGELQLLQNTIDDADLLLLQQTRQELSEYFMGQRHAFSVPLDPQGTGFQKKIWQSLTQIPFGSSQTYAQTAVQAGFKAGYGRAAGSAVGSNPISIIIPCHRVLASNGTLNGYGGGLLRKLQLLQIEGFTIE